MSDEPESIWQGSFMLGDLEMRCHVLSDGRRIIEAECLEALFNCPAALQESELEEFLRWVKEPKTPE